ncbi:HNH endonuclease [candidate division KSB1 bacterium]|nr:HNH endonuclease [candidate division KSB1 bacterium]
MSYIPASLKQFVILRAVSRCEYCRLPQEGQEATFHTDHIVPVAAGGETVAENLALACVSCSLRKGARQTANDPQSGKEVVLYNPRIDEWYEHFKWNGTYLIGLTASGRATIEALDMNRPLILAIRRAEAQIGRLPPFEEYV